MGLRITYRRTGGVFALITLGAIAFAVTTLVAAVTAAMLILAVTIGAVALLARTLWPRAWGRRPVPLSTAWPGQTIDAEVVHTIRSPDDRDLDRTNSVP